MKKVSNVTLAYIFYAIGSIDYVSANFFNNNLTGIPFSPILFGVVGSVFMFLHNSKIKESNNNIYEVFKLSLYAVLISDENIDQGELEYSVSILNTLESNLLIPVNTSKLEQDILKYDYKEIYKKIEDLESSIPYKTKLNILSTCSILCVVDGQIDVVEQEAIYKISNILNISNNDMKDIFNASIAKYIDFKSSGKENLEINDSEVNSVIEEKKKENKSNKNQTYIGLGLVMLLAIFSIYSSFQISTEESCDTLLDFYDDMLVIEEEYIKIDEENYVIWSNYTDVEVTDNYSQLSYADQIIVHFDLNVYKFDDSLQELDALINSFNNLQLNIDEISDDHINLSNALIEMNKIDLLRMQQSKSINSRRAEFINEYELYFEKWDSAADEDNETLMFVLDDNFSEYRNAFIDSFNELIQEDEILNDNIIDSYNNIYYFATEYCNTEFEE